MNKPARVIHPFLFSVFPVVFLYSHNIGEVFVSQTLLPLGVCLLGRSKFKTDGEKNKGFANGPLKSFPASLEGNILKITGSAFGMG